jgi:hypothetical protein
VLVDALRVRVDTPSNSATRSASSRCSMATIRLIERRLRPQDGLFLRPRDRAAEHRGCFVDRERGWTLLPNMYRQPESIPLALSGIADKCRMDEVRPIDQWTSNAPHAGLTARARLRGLLRHARVPAMAPARDRHPAHITSAAPRLHAGRAVLPPRRGLMRARAPGARDEAGGAPMCALSGPCGVALGGARSRRVRPGLESRTRSRDTRRRRQRPA